ncbi:DUF1385 domain-containing protein [Levilinea saccharolytica]|uniref:Metal-dependent enzyme n=1 Tax=Levilinea saccharolytica TaxID=229921 RepID=A0A0P6XXQ1_9CHLR|nr:DUF1385 domain-containing protein [Levilinea saccharolytica]KPL84990.1 hypothetical protein ADN01_06305 [Levilinea saccharolytica]GAP18085.1 predicted metal-dependent enzyme [Levilinea saccharolytica]
MSTQERMPSYGGQALIEGVLMRGARYVAAAFRAPNGEIIIKSEPLGKIYTSPVRKWPFLRGLILLWDALGLGIQYLTFSANIQGDEEEKIEGPKLYLTLGLSMGIAILIFFVAPSAIAHLFENWLKLSTWWGSVIEGVVRLAVLIGYVWGIGKMPEIRRVYQYHGAEHKTINAFEAGIELTPENVQACSREHPRCGTAFLLTLVLLSIVVFSLLGPLPIFWRLASRILLIPPLAGVAYEIIKFTANNLTNPIIKFLIRPNLAMQSLTTAEPDLPMLEVSIAAFNRMYALENQEMSLQNASVAAKQEGAAV